MSSGIFVLQWGMGRGGSRVAGRGSRVEGRGSRVEGRGSRVAGHESSVMVMGAVTRLFVIPAQAGIHEGLPAALHLPDEPGITKARKAREHESVGRLASGVERSDARPLVIPAQAGIHEGSPAALRQPGEPGITKARKGRGSWVTGRGSSSGRVEALSLRAPKARCRGGLRPPSLCSPTEISSPIPHFFNAKTQRTQRYAAGWEPWRVCPLHRRHQQIVGGLAGEIGA
jgi:hypothetical protein